MKKLFYTCAVFLVLFSLCSCSKKEEEKVDWNIDDGRIVILYGYGYNDEDFVKTSLELLSKNYSVDIVKSMDVDESESETENSEEQSLIVHFVFPDDFYVGGTSLTRISFLASYIEDINCKALITLGAPEFTHRSLAKIRDEEASSQCCIISLFSQDDVLSTEAESDIVVDFVEPEKEKSDTEIDISEEATMQHIEKTHYILQKTVEAVVENKFQDNQIQEVVLSLYGQEWEVGSYVDSSTGLKSRNHFVLKYVEKAPVPEKKKKGKIAK